MIAEHKMECASVFLRPESTGPRLPANSLPPVALKPSHHDGESGRTGPAGTDAEWDRELASGRLGRENFLEAIFSFFLFFF